MQYIDNSEITEVQKSSIYKLISRSESFLPDRIEINSSSNDNLVKVIYTYFLSKYLRTFRAIMLLMESSYGEDAMMLSRSLWEIWIRMLYTEENEKLAVLLFKVEFGRSMLKDVKRYRAVHGSPLPEDFIYIDQETFSDEKIKETIEEIKVLSPELAMKLLESGYEFWPGKSPRKMLEEIDKEQAWFYDMGYSLPSDLLHANIGGISNYIKIDGYTGIPQLTPNGNFSLSTANAAIGMLLQVLQMINTRFKLKKDQEIIELQNGLTVIFRRG